MGETSRSDGRNKSIGWAKLAGSHARDADAEFPLASLDKQLGALYGSRGDEAGKKISTVLHAFAIDDLDLIANQQLAMDSAFWAYFGYDDATGAIGDLV